MANIPIKKQIKTWVKVMFSTRNSFLKSVLSGKQIQR